MGVQIRWIPFVAWHFCVAAVVLSFITLFAGTSTSSESAAIITFNTSTLGLAELNTSNSTLHTAVTALLPTTPPTSASVTQYLGVKDWYSIHYLSTCSGYFSQSHKTNITCTHHASGYTFSLQSTLRSELLPIVKGLADDVSDRVWYTAPWIALWYIGLVCGLFLFFLLPWTWAGTRRLNGYAFVLALVGYLMMQISSSLVTTQSLNAHHNAFNMTDASIGFGPIPEPAPYALPFFALTWSATTCMIVCFLMMHFELRFELWTLKGDRITMYRKPQLKSWGLMESFAARKPVQIVAGHGYGDEEGVELR